MDFDVETSRADVKGARKINLIGFAILLAVFFFILGNRWGEIIDNFKDDSVVTETVSEGLPADLDYSSVEEVYDTLKKRYDGELSNDELLDGIKEGLARASGDDYTVYLNESDAQEFKNDLNGTFTGIGAEIGLEDDQLIIVAPLSGFPAQKAGLRAKDRILEIDGDTTFGMGIEEAVSIIRGEDGTEVTLTILRKSERFDIDIRRAKITVPSVKTEILDGNIGYIQLSRFAEDTTELMAVAAEEFVDKKVNGIILDLRNNSGGFLDASVEVLGHWIDNQIAVEQRQGDKVVQSLKTSRGASLAKISTIVLVNEGSASASEIVAGAMQDYAAGLLVGQTTFGKGSVQALEELNGGGVLKVTIARWYTPNGNNIDKSGITPDEEVEFTEEDYENEEDPQLEQALKILKAN